ncbi:eCIS core domain-containing protein [Streptomyces bacillaris]|uniref:eCIS core domain-containing protein n=1 Tax=Streptomyces bacillaris TaxID=68179 RepID=UPI00382A6E09
MDAYDSEREQQDHGHQDRPGHQDHPDHRDRGERAALGRDAHGEHGQGQGHEHGHSAQAHHLFRAAATGRADVVGTAGMGLLQRTVGNSALGPLIQRARSVSPSGTGPEQEEAPARDGAPVRDEAPAQDGAAGEQRSPVHDVISSGGGSPLDTDTRADMERRMGADFSDVRIHHDGAADASAKGVGAHAYTVGNNVVFQRDAYDPASPQGRTTLAHELTHVIQQRNGPVEGTEAPGGIRVSDPSDRFEREAVANAERVLADPAPETAAPAAEVAPAVAPAVPAAPASTPASAPAVQRTATEDEDEQPADVQGSFVQRAEDKKPEEDEEETPAE